MEEKQRAAAAVARWLPAIQKELDQVIEFWMKKSIDEKHGGFFTCLDQDGSVFDDVKYAWLQSRQVWMLMRLFNEVERFKNETIYNAAVKGAEFLFTKCRVQRAGVTRCAFSMTRCGDVIKIQRTLFSECFFVMAMSETWRGNQEEKYKNAAVSMMRNIRKWCMEDDSELGRELLPGCTPTSTLAVPMMALCVCKQMQECSIKWQDDGLTEWAVAEILLHVQRDGTRILENVSPTGKELPGASGRLQIPGHAIECGWFLIEYCQKSHRKDLAERAIEQFIVGPHLQGWDKLHGGLLYFIDADELPPTQLEWNMKLWWPHNEAMIAHLMAYEFSGEVAHLDRFDQAATYAFKKFSDHQQGEWFGYLNQKGEVSSRFKGGPWKGCFHVPRCLYLCEKILNSLNGK